VHTEGVDERALTGSGHAGDTDTIGIASVRQESFENLGGSIAVSRPIAFNQRNRAGECHAIAREDTVDVLTGV
jgi:hypothetical protein